MILNIKFLALNIILLFLCTKLIFAQKTTPSVQSLIKAEEYFNGLIKKNGIEKGYLKVAAEKGIALRPKPVSIKEFYAKKSEENISVNWEPSYAKISKNGDFGFTTGPYELKVDGVLHYGHYLSIWTNFNKRWKLLLDAGIEHQKPEKSLRKEFYEPIDNKYPRLLGPQKIQMREDIVFNTDILLGKSLKKSGNKTLPEFYDQNVRLYFPGNFPILGEVATLEFIKQNKFNIQCNPISVGRALSGDLAYTYGNAEINNDKYYYVRVWEMDNISKKWNIIIDLYNKADK
jgi:hypothetical protein